MGICYGFVNASQTRDADPLFVDMLNTACDARSLLHGVAHPARPNLPDIRMVGYRVPVRVYI